LLTLCEKIGIPLDQFAGHGRPCQLGERVSVVGLVGANGDLLDLVDSHLGGSPQALDNGL
jgi:hypothetical protein